MSSDARCCQPICQSDPPRFSARGFHLVGGHASAGVDWHGSLPNAVSRICASMSLEAAVPSLLSQPNWGLTRVRWNGSCSFTFCARMSCRRAAPPQRWDAAPPVCKNTSNCTVLTLEVPGTSMPRSQSWPTPSHAQWTLSAPRCQLLPRRSRRRITCRPTRQRSSRSRTCTRSHRRGTGGAT